MQFRDRYCHLSWFQPFIFFIGVRKINLLLYSTPFIQLSSIWFWSSRWYVSVCRWAWDGVNSWGTYRQRMVTFESVWRYRTTVGCDILSSADNMGVLVSVFSLAGWRSITESTIGDWPGPVWISRLVSPAFNFLKFFAAFDLETGPSLSISQIS